MEDYLPTSTNGSFAPGGAQSSSGNTWNFKNAVTFAGTATFNGGLTPPVIQATANANVTAAQSGSTFVFNIASGAILTLPAAALGLTYTFTAFSAT